MKCKWRNWLAVGVVLFIGLGAAAIVLFSKRDPRPTPETRFYSKDRESIRAIAISPDESRIAISTDTGEVTCWDLNRRTPILSYRGNDLSEYRPITFCEDSERLVFRATSDSVGSLDCNRGSGNTSIFLIGKRIMCLACSQDSGVVFVGTGGPDAALFRCDLRNGNGPTRIDLPRSGNQLTDKLRHVKWIDFCDGCNSLLVTTSTEVLVVERSTGIIQRSYRAHAPLVKVVAIPGRSKLALLTVDAQIDICDITTGEVEVNLSVVEHGVKPEICVSKNGDLIFASASLYLGGEGVLKIWRADSLSLICQARTSDTITGISFTSQNRKVLIASYGGTVTIWNWKCFDRGTVALTVD
jgi:WD40 repeat protein